MGRLHIGMSAHNGGWGVPGRMLNAAILEAAKSCEDLWGHMN